jgi:hypothetical protein
VAERIERSDAPEVQEPVFNEEMALRLTERFIEVYNEVHAAS